VIFGYVTATPQYLIGMWPRRRGFLVSFPISWTGRKRAEVLRRRSSSASPRPEG
jgi:hypothetical protein